MDEGVDWTSVWPDWSNECLLETIACMNMDKDFELLEVNRNIIKSPNPIYKPWSHEFDHLHIPSSSIKIGRRKLSGGFRSGWSAIFDTYDRYQICDTIWYLSRSNSDGVP